MKKIVRPLSQELNPVKIYLEDIEKIVETLHTVSDKVTLSTSDYLYEDLQQLLKELKQVRINRLEIKSVEPYVNLSFTPHDIHLYIENEDLMSRGLFEQIKQILAERERKIAQFFFDPALTGVFFGMFFTYGIGGIYRQNITSAILSLVFLIVGVVLGWFSYQFRLKNYSIIILMYEIELPSFLKRNSDKIILALLSALFGGIITFILFKVFGIAP